MYIKDLRCISSQPTFENDFFAGDPVIHTGVQYKAQEPSYAGLVPNSILRRMGKSNRLATGAAMPLLTDHKTDGIIIGTTDGGMDDCHRFLDQIVRYEEGTLTPTGFVQGSPNSAAGGLALMNANDGYNITHSNKGLSFENCIMDAQMLFDEGEADQLLIGCVEEISRSQLRIETLAGYVKLDEELKSSELFQSATTGSVSGEGAAMFVVSEDSQNAICKIKDSAVISNVTQEEVGKRLEQFLANNALDFDSIDAVILGHNGDVEADKIYDGIVARFGETTGKFTFKNLVGESPSASAFATWFGAQIIDGKQMPEMATISQPSRSINNLLIYNHYQSVQHGFILLGAI